MASDVLDDIAGVFFAKNLVYGDLMGKQGKTNKTLYGNGSVMRVSAAGWLYQAYYGIPVMFLAMCVEYIDDEMIDIFDHFDKILGRVPADAEKRYLVNETIRIAIKNLYMSGEEKDFEFVLTMILACMKHESMVLVPFDPVEEAFIILKLKKYPEDYLFDKMSCYT